MEFIFFGLLMWGVVIGAIIWWIHHDYKLKKYNINRP